MVLNSVLVKLVFCCGRMCYMTGKTSLAKFICKRLKEGALVSKMTQTVKLQVTTKSLSDNFVHAYIGYLKFR